MKLPDYWLALPPVADDTGLVAEFDGILKQAIAAGPTQPIPYTSSAPKWQFLVHVAASGRYVLHGSNNPEIARFEPRQSNDVAEFGNRTAIYASSDGVWPIFFAIADRTQHLSLVNASITELDDDQETRYYFSITDTLLAANPWRNGTVYILPNDGFELDREYDLHGYRVRANQVASLTAVSPLAKLSVQPEDFPFLAQVRGHDREQVTLIATADPHGFPWLEQEHPSTSSGSGRA